MGEERIALGTYEFFKGLQKGPLKELHKAASTRAFKDQEIIFRTGQKADHLYVVLSGKVDLLTEKLESEQERVPVPTPIHSVEPGEILGWSWLVAPYQWRFDAQAVGETRVIAVDGGVFRALCDKNPAFGYDVFKRLTGMIVDRLYAAKFQLSMHSGKPYSAAEGA